MSQEIGTHTAAVIGDGENRVPIPLTCLNPDLAARFERIAGVKKQVCYDALQLLSIDHDLRQGLEFLYYLDTRHLVQSSSGCQ